MCYSIILRSGNDRYSGNGFGFDFLVRDIWTSSSSHVKRTIYWLSPLACPSFLFPYLWQYDTQSNLEGIPLDALRMLVMSSVQENLLRALASISLKIYPGILMRSPKLRVTNILVESEQFLKFKKDCLLSIFPYQLEVDHAFMLWFIGGLRVNSSISSEISDLLYF